MTNGKTPNLIAERPSFLLSDKAGAVLNSYAKKYEDLAVSIDPRHLKPSEKIKASKAIQKTFDALNTATSKRLGELKTELDGAMDRIASTLRLDENSRSLVPFYASMPVENLLDVAKIDLNAAKVVSALPHIQNDELMEALRQTHTPDDWQAIADVKKLAENIGRFLEQTERSHHFNLNSLGVTEAESRSVSALGSVELA